MPEIPDSEAILGIADNVASSNEKTDLLLEAIAYALVEIRKELFFISKGASKP